MLALFAVFVHHQFMAKTLLNQADLRVEFYKRSARLTNKEIGAEAGVSTSSVWNVCAGAPITGKLLKWLGYEKTEPMYRKVKEVGA